MSAHHHRSTLKQQNKPFKARHSTKSSLKEQAKGRVPRATPKPSSSASIAAQTKINRRNHAKQLQLMKRQSLAEATKIFNGVDGAPRIVAVLPLCPDVDARALVGRLAGVFDADVTECPAVGTWKMRAERFRASLQFILLPYGAFYASLDAAKVADYVVLGFSTENEVHAQGDLLLRCLQAQGLPQTLSVVNTTTTTQDPKSQAGILKSLLSFTQYFVPTASRVYDLCSSSHATVAMRSLCEGKPAEVKWRTGRSYILADAVHYEGEDKGTLKVTGVVRGSTMSADRLVHIPNWGDFRISRILAKPSNSTKRGAGGAEAMMEVETTPIKVLSEPTEAADDLISTNDPDDMANEQTWPTEDDMASNPNQAAASTSTFPDAKSGTTPKSIKRVPKGTSSYQAAWLLDDEEGDEDEDEEDYEDVPAEEDEQMAEDDEDQSKSIIGSKSMAAFNEDADDAKSMRTAHFEDIDMEEEAKQLADWRAREREHGTHAKFPDEIDTPMDIPARERFARFRGLKSFRTSSWDPDENLPRDYAKIFRVGKNEWEATSRKVEFAKGVSPGTHVIVEIADVPKEVAEQYQAAAGSKPFAIFGLHKHEHKKTVVHLTVQHNTEYKAPVRSKDPLILCVGPRRFTVRPLFSQHLRAGAKSSNNVHKFERYLHQQDVSVATIYGPLIFGKLPCMLLKENQNGEAPSLVGTGTLLPPDTSRIIAKRIVLTGHPIKVHKKTATIRYMFFNPEDIMYFKPVQLHTKFGRIGHIKESLGTHGYFKAHFDGPITQMDTICMNLYKRVYPKWALEWKENGKENGVVLEEDAMEE